MQERKLTKYEEKLVKEYKEKHFWERAKVFLCWYWNVIGNEYGK